MEEVIKNFKDNCNYRVIKLPNQINCLLISDQNIDVSSFCLNISIGALEDPLEYQGLAHVLEHFLFAGSEKYPDFDDFSNFLLNNAGSINTGTDLDHSNYCFECNSSVFEQGLERFISYFKSPKFNSIYLDKILQVIHSEFEINKNSNYYQNFQILRNISDKKSCFNKFGMGNKNSLKPGKGLLDSLINFFNNFYSANLMKVVVYAKEDLNSLEELIRKYVCLIPDKNIPKPLYSLAPFNQNNMKKIIKMSSNGNIDELNLIWIHDYQKDTKYSKPFNYIWYIFNYGGKNSLFSIFKKLEYVYDLNVKISNYFENFLSFEIKLKLTPLGFQKTQEIINIIFEYIDFILKKGVSKTLFDEAQKLSILNFHYSKLKIDFQYLSTLAKKLGNIPFKYLLIEEYLWENFDEKLICDSLTNFKLDNLIIFLNSKNIDKTNKFDLFYESNYSLEQIDDNLLVKGFTNNFNMIPMNPFLPISTKIVPISEMESLKEFTKIPKKIYSSEESEIFYKIDNKFKTPKCLIRLRIQLIDTNIENNEQFFLFCLIWKDFIIEQLSETAAQILRAHGNFYLNIEEYSFFLHFYCFSETISIMVQKIVDDINNCLFENKKEKFDRIVEGLNHENENFLNSDPWVLSDHLLKLIIMKNGAFNKKALLNVGKNLKFENFLEFTKTLIPQSKYEWLIYGNLEKNHALEIAKYFEENFLSKNRKKTINQKSYLGDSICCLKIKEKTSNVFEYILEKEAPKNLNYSCLSAYWQIGRDTPKNRILAYMITYLISDEIYQDLSLNGKLGYSENGYDLLRGVLGYKVKVISKNSCSHYLQGRVEETITKLKEIIFKIDEKKFEDMKNIVLLGITSESIELEEEFDNDWVQLSRKEFEFNRDNLEREELKRIHRKDIEEFFVENFLFNPKKLEIHVSHKYFNEQNAVQINQRIKEEKDLKLRKISSIDLFKETEEYFPSYY